MWSDLAGNVLLLQLLVSRASCFVNVAHKPEKHLQGTATMNGDPYTPNWSADKVVDGNTDQTATGGSCAIMAFSGNYRSVWLNVQLQRLFNVAYIEIYFRNEFTLNRLAGFSIYALYEETFDPASLDPNSVVYRHDPMSGCPAPILNITVNKLARHIVYANQRPGGYQSTCSRGEIYTNVEICEIKVMGCDQNRYSSGCQSLCSTDCKDRHCDAFNGSCIYGCSDLNVNTFDCKGCNGTYGDDCIYPCPTNCEDRRCDINIGHCLSCVPGYKGPICNQVCSTNTYGQSCDSNCGNCSNGETCHHINGTCLHGCAEGAIGDTCQEECQSGYYGRNCSHPCSANCIVTNQCDRFTGRCDGGCKPGWTGNTCNLIRATTCNTKPSPCTESYNIVIVVISVMIVVTGSLINIVIWKRNSAKFSRMSREKMPQPTNRTGTIKEDKDHQYTELEEVEKYKTYEEIHSYSNRNLQ